MVEQIDPMTGRLHTYMEIVDVNNVRQNRDMVVSQFLAPTETHHMTSKPPASLAGYVATKKALVKLVRDRLHETQTSEKDFILNHDPRGGLVLQSVPIQHHAALRTHDISISMSHTANTAVGIVVYRENGDG